MRFILYFFLFFQFLYASNITYHKQSLISEIEIAIVNNDSLSLDEMIAHKSFIPNISGKQNFGYKQQIFWIKTTITNNEKKAVDQLFELQFVPLDYVDVYVMDAKGHLTTHFVSGDLRPIDQRIIKSKYHLFPLTFESNETKTIYIKLKNSGAMVIDPILYEPDHFWQHTYPTRESFITAFLSIIVFFTLYNIVLFFSLKEISFVYYVLAMLSMLSMQITLFGVAYEHMPFLGLWNLTVLVNIGGALFILFSILFVGSYFELKHYSPRFEKFYRYITLSLYIPLTLLMLYPPTYSSVIPITALLGMVMVVFIAILSYIGFRSSPINSRYIFIGWLFSGGLMFIYVLELVGILHIKIVDDLIFRTGTLIEMIFFSFALGDKLKYIKNKVTQAEIKALETEKQLLLQARLAAAGETVGNIAHQWRQPLNRLSMILLKIQSDLYFRPDIERESIAHEAQKSEAILKDMSHTIDLFLNFFSNKDETSSFDLIDAINDALFIVDPVLKGNDIVLELKIDNSNTIMHGSKSELSQVFLNILTNAQHALNANNIIKKKINLSVINDNNFVTICIEDNAGGIKIKPISAIFEPYVSTNQNKNGTGLGLYIARSIIIQRFLGEIFATNTQEGALFTIKFNLPIKKNT